MIDETPPLKVSCAYRTLGRYEVSDSEGVRASAVFAEGDADKAAIDFMERAVGEIDTDDPVNAELLEAAKRKWITATSVNHTGVTLSADELRGWWQRVGDNLRASKTETETHDDDDTEPSGFVDGVGGLDDEDDEGDDLDG